MPHPPRRLRRLDSRAFGDPRATPWKPGAPADLKLATVLRVHVHVCPKLIRYVVSTNIQYSLASVMLTSELW